MTGLRVNRAKSGVFFIRTKLLLEAGYMGQLVNELMQLVGGHGQNPGSASATKRINKVPMSVPLKKRNASTNGNGHAAGVPVLAGNNGHRETSPDDMFKDF